MVITDLGHGETRYTLLSYRFSLKLGGEKRSPYITVYTGLCEDRNKNTDQDGGRK